MSKRNTKAAWVDPDDAPELTDEWFETADVYHGDKLISRGTPQIGQPPRRPSPYASPDVLDKDSNPEGRG